MGVALVIIHFRFPWISHYRPSRGVALASKVQKSQASTVEEETGAPAGRTSAVKHCEEKGAEHNVASI